MFLDERHLHCIKNTCLQLQFPRNCLKRKKKNLCCLLILVVKQENKDFSLHVVPMLHLSIKTFNSCLERKERNNVIQEENRFLMLS